MQYIFDIETIAKPETEIRASLPPFDPKSVAVPKTHTKPETIAAFIAKAGAEYGDDIVERAALNPQYGTIAIVGILEVLKDGVTGALIQLHGDEKEALGTMWEMLASGLNVVETFGWNVRGFDFPFCIKRSLILGVDVPKNFWQRRQRYPITDRVCDLMEVFTIGNYRDGFTSLDNALKQLGLPAKTGSGSDFGKLWESDQKAALAYNAADLDLERQIAKRFGVIP